MTKRIKVSANRRFLVYEDNSPFFYLGDTAWELAYRLTRDEVRFYLEDRALKGFTVVHMMGLPELGELKRPNMEGQLPLRDADPARPNEKFFDFVEFVLETAAAFGIHVGVAPCWGDHVGPPLHVGKNPQILNPDNAFQYGAFWGKRFPDHSLLWILGGDRPIQTDRQLSTWRQLAAGLAAGDGGYHLRTYHPHVGFNSSRYFQNDPWLDFNLIQTGHFLSDGDDESNLRALERQMPGIELGRTYETVARDYAKSPVKPTMETEYCYENHPVNWEPRRGRFDNYDSRKGAYWSVFAGGFGFVYGCNDIFSFYRGPEDLSVFGPFSPILPWQQALHLPGAREMRYLRNLIESRPFLSRIPDQSLLASDPGTGAAHAQATRDEEGRYAFIYSSAGQPVSVDLTRLAGERVVAWWFDPRLGTATKIDEFARQGVKVFNPPSCRYGHDWVLVLDEAAQKWPAPGVTSCLPANFPASVASSPRC